MKQGEIWLVNLDPAVGAEMQKIRPALIVSADALGVLPLKIIAPITGWKEHFRPWPWMVQLVPSGHNGLDKVSAVDCFQLRAISVTRLIRYIGVVDPAVVLQVKDAIHTVIAS